MGSVVLPSLYWCVLFWPRLYKSPLTWHMNTPTRSMLISFVDTQGLCTISGLDAHVGEQKPRATRQYFTCAECLRVTCCAMHSAFIVSFCSLITECQKSQRIKSVLRWPDAVSCSYNPSHLGGRSRKIIIFLGQLGKKHETLSEK
jgi:hypothetical protein